MSCSYHPSVIVCVCLPLPSCYGFWCILVSSNIPLFVHATVDFTFFLIMNILIIYDFWQLNKVILDIIIIIKANRQKDDKPLLSLYYDSHTAGGTRLLVSVR